jgi:molybdopterin molybdotransferase
MITIKEALEIIQNNIPEKKESILPLKDSLNLVLADDIYSPEPLPRFTNSAMDGFAIKWRDVETATTQSPVELKIAGESRAGIPFFGTVEKGTAISISTGGMLPDGTSTIIPVEFTETDGNVVKIKISSKKGEHVRFEGEEVEKDNILLEYGQVLNPACIGLLASVGIQKIKVFIKPNVSIITTGTELMPLDGDLKPWQIRDSNSIMLKGAVIQSGGNIVFISQSKDDLESIKSTIKEVEEKSDVIILSGGVSVGPHDFVKQAAMDMGFKQLFWRVLQKPGKPLFVAYKENKILFGLPGNPVSTLNCYAYYVHPVIQELLGKKFAWKTVVAKMSDELTNTGNRPIFERLLLNSELDKSQKAIPIEKLGSHMLTSIAYADGFIIIEPEVSIQKNEKVIVYLYPWES